MDFGDKLSRVANKLQGMIGDVEDAIPGSIDDKLFQTVGDVASFSTSLAPGLLLDAVRVLPGIELRGGAWDYFSTKHTLASAGDLLVGEGTLTGYVIGGTAHLLDEGYRYAIEDNLEAGIYAASGQSWGTAYRLARQRTLGQTAILGVSNAFGDDDAKANWLDAESGWSDFAKSTGHSTLMNVAAFGVDIVPMFFADPALIGLKAVGAFRNAKMATDAYKSAQYDKVFGTAKASKTDFDEVVGADNEILERIPKTDFKPGVIDDLKNVNEVMQTLGLNRNSTAGPLIAKYMLRTKGIKDQAVRVQTRKALARVYHGDATAFRELAELDKSMAYTLSNVVRGKGSKAIDAAKADYYRLEDIVDGVAKPAMLSPQMVAGTQDELLVHPDFVALYDKVARVEPKRGGRFIGGWVDARARSFHGVDEKTPITPFRVTASGQRALARTRGQGLGRDGTLHTGRAGLDKAVNDSWVRRPLAAVFAADPFTPTANIVRGGLKEVSWNDFGKAVGQTALYSLGAAPTARALSRSSEALRDVRIYGALNVEQGNEHLAGAAIDHQLRIAGVEAKKRSQMVSAVIGADNPTKRAAMVKVAQDYAIKTISQRYGITTDVALNIARGGIQYANGIRSVVDEQTYSMIRSSLDETRLADGRKLDFGNVAVIPGESGATAIVADADKVSAILKSQGVNKVELVDLERLSKWLKQDRYISAVSRRAAHVTPDGRFTNKLRDQFQSLGFDHTWRAQAERDWAIMMGDAVERSNSLWKQSVLGLRAGSYAVRNTLEEQLRVLALGYTYSLREARKANKGYLTASGKLKEAPEDLRQAVADAEEALAQHAILVKDKGVMRHVTAHAARVRRNRNDLAKAHAESRAILRSMSEQDKAAAGIVGTVEEQEARMAALAQAEKAIRKAKRPETIAKHQAVIDEQNAWLDEVANYDGLSAELREQLRPVLARKAGLQVEGARLDRGNPEVARYQRLLDEREALIEEVRLARENVENWAPFAGQQTFVTEGGVVYDDVEEAFRGQSGRTARDRLDAGTSGFDAADKMGHLSRSVGRTRSRLDDSQVQLSIADGQQSAGYVNNYFHEWEDQLNHQIALDEAARVALRAIRDGHAPEEIAGRVKQYLDSGSAREYRNQNPLYKDDTETWAWNITDHVDGVVAARPELAQAILDGPVTAKGLREMFDDYADTPALHRAHGSLLFGTHGTIFQKTVSQMFENIDRATLQRFTRHPMFHLYFNDSLERKLSSWEALVRSEGRQAIKRGEHDVYVTGGEIERLAQEAREEALHNIKRTFYDATVRSGAAHQLRFIFPFFAAHQDSVRFWGQTLGEDPSVFRKLQLGFEAPRNMGVVVDENGQPKDFKDPVNPLKDAVITPLPHFLGGEFKVPLSSAMLMLQSGSILNPGAGPMAAVPAAYFQKHLASRDEELDRALKFFNPYGAPKNEGIDQALATPIKRLREAWDSTVGGQDNADTVHLLNTRLIDAYVDYRNEHDGKIPSQKEWATIADKESAKVRYGSLMRLMASVVSPGQPQPSSTHHAMLAEYRRLADKGRTEGKPPGWALDEFIETYGEAAYALTQSQSATRGHVAPTAGALAALHAFPRLRNQTSIDSWGMIIGPEGNGAFSMNAYRAMQEVSMKKGSPEKISEALSPDELFQRIQLGEGWQSFNKQIAKAMTRSRERGFILATNDPQFMEEKSRINDAVALDNPTWGDLRYQSKVPFSRLLRDAELISQDKRLLNDPGRSDIRYLGLYLQMRREVESVLAEQEANKIKGGGNLDSKINESLKYEFNKRIAALVQNNEPFREYILPNLVYKDPFFDEDIAGAKRGDE